MNVNLAEVRRIVKRALAEDVGSRDITSSVTIPPASVSRAQIVAKDEGVIAGLQVAAMVFAAVVEADTAKKGREIHFLPKVKDGFRTRRGDVVAEVTGSTAAILTLSLIHI